MRVTAILVSHDAERYLPATLTGLALQSRQVDAVVAVDTGSVDGSLNILRGQLPRGSRLVHADRHASFGQAVARGLADLDATVGGRLDNKTANDVGSPAAPGVTQATATAPPETATDKPNDAEWLWLLHDDSEPDPDALAELLRAVETAPSVTIAGCKQLYADDRRSIMDVGVHLSTRAERLTLIEPGEQDQGQYDGRSDVFAVNSAGMLIRRDVWDALEGFDPALPSSGDDVDLCWRNRLAGHRVVVVPSARMYHAGDRTAARSAHKNHALRRRAQVYQRLVHTPAWRLPFTALGALLGSLWTLLISILAKDPGYGLTDVGATIATLARPFSLARSRRVAKRERKVSRSIVKDLTTSPREVRAHRRARSEAMIGPVVGDGLGADDAGTDPNANTDDDDFTSIATAARGNGAVGFAALAVVTVLAGLIAFHRVLLAPALSGGALLPAAPTLAQLWTHATSWWSTLQAGWPAAPTPFAWVIWLFGVIGFGNANVVIVWVHALALALSAASAWWAIGAFSARRSVRFWGALTWAALPLLQTSLGSGRIGSVLAHIFIPLVILGLSRAVGAARTHRIDERGRVSLSAMSPRAGTGGVTSWTAAAAAGLALAVVTAASPVLLPAAVLGVVVLVLVLRRRARTVWWALLPSLVLIAPVVVENLMDPRRILGDPAAPLAQDAAPAWQQLLGGSAPVSWDATVQLIVLIAVGAPVLALAIAALFGAGRRSSVARGLWFGALLVLATGALAPLIATAVDGDRFVAPDVAPAASVVVFCLLAAAAVLIEHVTVERRRRPGQPVGAPLTTTGRRVGVLVCTALCVAPLLSVALFTADRAAPDSPIPAAAPDANLPVESATRSIPATAADRGLGPERTRTLVLHAAPVPGSGSGATPGINAQLVSGAGTSIDELSPAIAASMVRGEIGEEELTADDAATATLRRAVASLATGGGTAPSSDLESLGVGFVVLKGDDSGSDLLAAQLDTMPGLNAVGRTDSGWLWRVSPSAGDAAATPTRARLVDPSGSTLAWLTMDGAKFEAEIPAGTPGRRVVLAERTDPHWAGSINGSEAASTTGLGASTWAQAFEVPAEGGHFTAKYDNPASTPWAIAQIVIFGLTVLLALPLRMPRQLTPHWLESDESVRRWATQRSGATALGADVDDDVAPLARVPEGASR